MKKILDVVHRMDDYTCMWNGAEDLYIRDTGKNDETEQFPMLFSQVADIMKAGFETLPM